MTKQSQLERLTQVQLIQKIIHLESELSLYRTERESKNRRFQEKIMELKHEKVVLKGEIQKLLDEQETYYEERDELIRDYNEFLLKKDDYEKQISFLKERNDDANVLNQLENYEKENERLTQMVDQLNKKNMIQKEMELRLLEEKKNLKSELEGLRTHLSELEEEHAVGEEIILLKKEIEKQTITRKKTTAEKEEIYRQKEALLRSLNEMQNQLKQRDEKLENYKANEQSISDELIRIGEDFSKAQIMINEIQTENNLLKQKLEKKSADLGEAIKQHEEMSKEINQFTQQLSELQHNNDSFKVQIKQLEIEKGQALKTNSNLKTELLNEKKQLKEIEVVKNQMANLLESGKIEMNRLEEENKQYKTEKVELLNKITHLEKENLSFHERLIKLTELREHDEKRLNKISTNLNEVFQETKQLVRMTSSLKHQLEAKVLELNQIKDDKKHLESELSKLKRAYESSELRNKELENKIDQMGIELHNAKQSLSHLEQLEGENLQLSEELEAKMEEFILITENYQRENLSYLNDLEHFQDQLKESKEKENRFEAEKAALSIELDELKTELEQTKNDLQRKEELEKKNNKLAEKLKAKEIEIYKIKKENELALLKKTNYFNSEITMKQDHLMQSEVEREKLEKQINEIKAQFNVLESSLEEKEDFIRQFIKQPLSQPNLGSQVTEENNQQKLPMAVEQHVQEIPIHQQVHQSLDWFQQIKAQQQCTYQKTPAHTKSLNPSTMDFFELRNKTTQSMILPKQQK
ncbi:hypothetical protein [Bacillus sp. EB600]|uniref:hypothetical protein n=1 Tax=Bacillus sp. EB600 TaxID=2806345 RepID=UPI00210BF48E|nr:hypothetical protein [Bacillus sp. EB600]MCQ6282554.1 hypothetical protein [Bacillus sp. EB600]